MFLATSILQNWIFWVAVVAVVAIIAIIVTNIIIDSKIKQIEKRDIAEKEQALHEKLYPSENVEKSEEQEQKNEPTEEKTEEVKPAEEEKVEEAKPVEEEKAEEVKPAEEQKVEEAKPVEEEKTEEAKPVEEEKAEEVKPAKEQKVEEAKPVEEEKAEEVKPAEEQKVEEAKPVEEKKEEKKPVKKAVTKKAPAKEAKKEPVEEKKDEKSDKEAEKEAEDLLKDIPDSDEIEKELEEKQAQEEAVKEEEIKEEEMKKEEQKVKATPKTSVKDENKKPKQSNGKWLLIPESDGYFFGKLFANNGEMLLQTERYKGVSGLKSGIETIKKNIAKDNFEITVDKNKTYNFKLFASNQGLLCIGEGYTSRENALSAIQSVKNFSNSLTFVSDETEQIEEKKFSITEDEKNTNGKWVIFEGTDGYNYAELKANNGQVLFVTEQYKGINSLRTGLDSVRKNIAKGNFAMRKDKNDNYNFKLFSENKRLLGIGAGYTSANNCESAILSVMKFSDSVIVFNNAEEVEE